MSTYTPTLEDWAPYYQRDASPTPPEPPHVPTPAGMVRVDGPTFHRAIGPLERLEYSPEGRYDHATGYRGEWRQGRQLVALTFGGTHLCPRVRFLVPSLLPQGGRVTA